MLLMHETHEFNGDLEFFKTLKLNYEPFRAEATNTMLS